jgi:hypothetical protein
MLSINTISDAPHDRAIGIGARAGRLSGFPISRAASFGFTPNGAIVA